MFLNLSAFERDGSAATIKVVLMPLVMWLWVAGGVMASGTAVAMWPQRRHARTAAPAAARDPVEPVPQGEEVVAL